MAPADGTGYIKGEPIKRQRVAIVGSGLAGLTIAYLLNRDNFDVEIFEMVRAFWLFISLISMAGNLVEQICFSAKVHFWDESTLS